MNIVDMKNQQHQMIEAPAQNVSVGLTTIQGFELAQRAAKLLSSSSLVPERYRGNIADCVVALNMAQRMGADPLMAMQNLYIVHGTPAWSSCLRKAGNSTSLICCSLFLMTLNSISAISRAREWVGVGP